MGGCLDGWRLKIKATSQEDGGSFSSFSLDMVLCCFVVRRTSCVVYCAFILI